MKNIDNLIIKHIPEKGRGVIANCDFNENQMIEKCPIIIIPEKDMELIKKTKLNNYYFEWGEFKNKGVLALGKGSLYNHSFNPNAIYETDYKNKLLIFKAIRKIQKGTEITINYNGRLKDKTPLWFEIK